MNNDRELLELAAKAAGIDIDEPVNGWYVARYDENGNPDAWWNPLTDDGDALRLAVELGIEFGFGWNGENIVCVISPDNSQDEWVKNGDPYAATRRAIVRAAAEIGKEQK